MMVARLIYSYCPGEHSSNHLERHGRDDIADKVIMTNQLPDYTTISYQLRLKKLFLEILRLCSEAGLVKLGQVSPDGTIINSNYIRC